LRIVGFYDIYKPYILAPFLCTITNNMVKPLTSEAASFYPYGLDVVSWLTDSMPQSSTAYLASILISSFLIGLTQYLIICHVPGFMPQALHDHISGATGYSEGL
jgi:fatty acid synthase subunit alpha, fungi type